MEFNACYEQNDISVELSDVEKEREHSFSLTHNTSIVEDSEFKLSEESECGFCDFIGSSRTEIEEHIVNNHSECTRCNSKFRTVEDIRNLAHVNMVIQLGGHVVPHVRCWPLPNLQV